MKLVRLLLARMFWRMIASAILPLSHAWDVAVSGSKRLRDLRQSLTSVILTSAVSGLILIPIAIVQRQPAVLVFSGLVLLICSVVFVLKLAQYAPLYRALWDHGLHLINPVRLLMKYAFAIWKGRTPSDAPWLYIAALLVTAHWRYIPFTSSSLDADMGQRIDLIAQAMTDSRFSKSLRTLSGLPRICVLLLVGAITAQFAFPGGNNIWWGFAAILCTTVLVGTAALITARRRLRKFKAK